MSEIQIEVADLDKHLASAGGAASTQDIAKSKKKKLALVVLGLLLAALLAFGVWQMPSIDGASGQQASALTAANAAQSTPRAELSPAEVLAENARSLDALQPVFSRGDELLVSAASSSSATDARLLRIYGLIATSQATQALDEAANLARDLPNFGLAQLVYADLLTSMTTPTDGFGAINQPMRAQANERLGELVAEARARVVAASHRPPASSIPLEFVRIDPTVRHAIAVDVSKSRLYVFENTAKGLVLKKDYYSSVGKLGLSKQVEGDQRTPIGLYFGTGRVSDAKLREPVLEDRYGVAAIVLNYPNQYDQFKGRTGSGIWLHGVATSQFSRAPLATDGCVAVSNPDMIDLTHIVERQETPILISEKIEWVSPQAAEQRRTAFMKTFDAWKAARTLVDADALQQFYALDADTGRADRRRQAITPAPKAKIDGVSVVWWKDDREVVVVTYSETLAGQSRTRLKRQYWLQEEGSWKVIFEGSLA